MIDIDASAAKEADTLPSMFHETLVANVGAFQQMDKYSKVAIGESFVDGASALAALILRDFKGNAEVVKWFEEKFGPQYLTLVNTLELSYALMSAMDEAKGTLMQKVAATDDGLDMLDRVIKDFNNGH